MACCCGRRAAGRAISTLSKLGPRVTWDFSCIRNFVASISVVDRLHKKGWSVVWRARAIAAFAPFRLRTPSVRSDLPPTRRSHQTCVSGCFAGRATLHGRSAQENRKTRRRIGRTRAPQLDRVFRVFGALGKPGDSKLTPNHQCVHRDFEEHCFLDVRALGTFDRPPMPIQSTHYT